MKNNGIDSKVMKEACRDYVLASVINSEKLKQKIKPDGQVKLCEYVMEMSYKNLLSVIFHDGAAITVKEAREDEGKIKKLFKYGIAGAIGRKVGKTVIGGKPFTVFNKELVKGAKTGTKYGRFGATVKGGLRGALSGVAVLYLFRKLTDPCVRASKGSSQKKYQCYSAASSKILQTLAREKNRCSKTTDPAKCREKIKKEFTKWQKIHLKNKKLAAGSAR